jgi:hypothetical protein
MAGRRSFKADESFPEKRAIGAIHLARQRSAIRNLRFELKRSLAQVISDGSHGTAISPLGLICNVA